MKRIQALLLATVLLLAGFLIPPYDISSAPLDNDDCEECHSEFNAFTVTIDAPSEVPENYDFEYKVIVRNNGEHDVQSLQAVIYLTEAPNLQAQLEGGEPHHEEVSGSVTAGGTQTYIFPVVAGASEAKIVLDGDDGLLGLNDIDLTVRSPSGQEWASADSGADEQVTLDAKDLMRGGAGDYEVEIVWFVGSPSISFSLIIDVEYGVDQLIFQGPDLAPGEKHTFVLPLKSMSKGENTIKTAVSATAYHEHSESDDPLITDSKDYTIEESWNLEVGEKFVYEPPDEEFQGTVSILLLERITGLLAGLLLIFSIVLCGYLKPLSSRVEGFLGGKVKRIKWHCWVSLLLLSTSLFHGILLPFSPHARSLKGLALGIPAFLILTALGYFGWQQGSLRKKWGAEKWSKVHLLLTILAVIIVAIHAILEGSDFAWLR
jgi:hypothetical protein